MTIEWKDLADVTGLSPGEVRELSHDGTDLLIFRTQSGALRAMKAYCPHMGNYIPNGLAPNQELAALLHGEELVCPFHNWRFDGLGFCSGIPDGQRMPARVAKCERITDYWPLRETNGVIQIGPAQSAPTTAADAEAPP